MEFERFIGRLLAALFVLMLVAAGVLVVCLLLVGIRRICLMW